MTALALKLKQTGLPQFPQSPALRAIVGGTIAGISLSVGLTALTFYGCGAFCLADALVTTALSVGAGIITIAPVTILSAHN